MFWRRLPKIPPTRKEVPAASYKGGSASTIMHAIPWTVLRIFYNLQVAHCRVHGVKWNVRITDYHILTMYHYHQEGWSSDMKNLSPVWSRSPVQLSAYSDKFCPCWRENLRPRLVSCMNKHWSQGAQDLFSPEKKLVSLVELRIG